LVGVALVDLLANNVAAFRLTDELPARNPEVVLHGDPPVRFCEQNVSESVLTLRYSGLVRRTMCEGLGLIGTNEGGALPVVTERLFDAVLKNPDSALPASACGYQYISSDDRWARLDGALPRIRLYPMDAESIATRPIGELTAADLERIRHYLANTTDKVEWIEQIAQRVRVRVQSSADVIMVLADTYYPGWKCLVDGVEEPIWPAHGVFQGVNLPAGTHEVDFRFSPRSLWAGGALSLLGCIILAGLANHIAGKSRPFASTVEANP
jgi:hypothetical protein